jgi:YidC/Oxa1 family membrane protein insertase
VLDFIYYPVSFILWCWHWVFGKVLGDNNGAAWALAIVFLVFSLRAIMFKPFVKQVRSMRKMQEFAPELKKIQKKYANDRQKQAAEMQKLQQQHGFSPLGGCLPMLLQIPVFIGLNHVLRSFGSILDNGQPRTENYFFDQRGVESYNLATIFGAKLNNFITEPLASLGTTDRSSVILVAVPLMIAASIATHFTARHSVSRQNAAAATSQTAIMNKVTLYLFPLGVLVFGAFFLIGLLLYWLSNNGWTLMQQRLVYKKIDQEEEEKKTEAVEKRNALAPKPGQKPTAGQKPVTRKPTTATTTATGSSAEKTATTPKPGQKPVAKAGGAKPAAAKPGAKPAVKPATKPATKPSGQATASSNGANGSNASNEIPGLIPDRARSKKSGRKKS